MNQLTNKNDAPGAGLEQDWLEFGRAHGKKIRGLVAEAARRELFRQRREFIAREVAKELKSLELVEMKGHGGEEENSGEMEEQQHQG
eukprot:8845766-Pyramimonas_sp.AAC.1